MLRPQSARTLLRTSSLPRHEDGSLTRCEAAPDWPGEAELPRGRLTPRWRTQILRPQSAHTLLRTSSLPRHEEET